MTDWLPDWSVFESVFYVPSLLDATLPGPPTPPTPPLPAPAPPPPLPAPPR
jgi:hypothetical protein